MPARVAGEHAVNRSPNLSQKERNEREKRLHRPGGELHSKDAAGSFFFGVVIERRSSCPRMRGRRRRFREAAADCGRSNSRLRAFFLRFTASRTRRSSHGPHGTRPIRRNGCLVTALTRPLPEGEESERRTAPVRNTFLVCYDICDDKRLRRVFKTMRDFGDHLQYSIFECQFTPIDLARCRHILGEIIKHNEDQVLFVDLGPVEGRGERVISALGQPYSPIDAPCIVV